MKKTGLTLLSLAVLAVLGCGGPGASQESSVNLDLTVLNAESGYLIEGIVYNDLDGNGAMDIGEPGVSGVVVTLAGLDDTTTDSRGYYAFFVSAGGSYTVEETDPPGYTSTTANSFDIVLTDQGVQVDFGDASDVPTYSIYGTVFDDLDLDGVMEAGEPGIPDVVVSLSGVGEVPTAADGTFAFGVTVARFYTVTEYDPEGYVSITPNQMEVEIVADNIKVDFGDRAVADIPVDVKPGSDINPINLRSKGVLPVAILGSADLDVSLIDPASLLLNGVAPLRWNTGDVCGSQDPDPLSVDDQTPVPDGYADMTLKFSTQEIAATLGEVKRGDIEILTMTGNLLDGTPAAGEQLVWIVQAQK